jgi:hypothetical protein
MPLPTASQAGPMSPSPSQLTTQKPTAQEKDRHHDHDRTRRGHSQLGDIREAGDRYLEPRDRAVQRRQFAHLPGLDPHGLFERTRRGVDLPTPPAPVPRLAARLHPAFRRAEKTAMRPLADRFWMGEHQRWVEERRSRLEADCRRFATVDLGPSPTRRWMTISMSCTARSG